MTSRRSRSPRALRHLFGVVAVAAVVLALVPAIAGAQESELRIEGTVTTSDGTPVEDVWVMGYRDGDTWVGSLWAHTDEDGNYVLEGAEAGVGYRIYFVPPSGSNLIRVWAIHDGTDWSTTTDRAASTEVVVTDTDPVAHVDATLARGGVVEGTVLKDGVPAAGVAVWLYRDTDTWVGSFAGTTGDDGTYRIEGVVPIGTPDEGTEFKVMFRPPPELGLGVSHVWHGADTRAAATKFSVALDDMIDISIELGTPPPPPPPPPPPTAGAASVSAGTGFGCAITAAGGVRCWGTNNVGQLGNGTLEPSPTPVPVTGLTGVVAIDSGAAHTCAILESGGLVCWGYGQYGRLGNGSTTTQWTPVAVSGLDSGVVAVSAGEEHTCALTDGGAAKCWGYNVWSQLGRSTFGTNSFVPGDVIGLDSGVTAISAGTNHSCAIVDGAATCWGHNIRGQLGNGTVSDPVMTPGDVVDLDSGVTDISAGNSYSCAIVDGAAKCWGDNAVAQLGNGGVDDDPVTTPDDVSGLDSGQVAISTGHFVGCALSDEGALRCWGWNAGGTLGNGASTGTATTSVGVVGLSSGVTEISAGGNHSCARVNGGVKCWGNSGLGQIGNGSTDPIQASPAWVNGFGPPAAVQSQRISAAATHSCAITDAGGVQCWGSGGLGRLGNGSTDDTSVPVDVVGLSSGATAVSAGANHTCAVVNGAAKCWGSGAGGYLGDGLNTQSTTPVDVVGLGVGVTAISAGATHTCAIVNGAAKCWGNGTLGVLGNDSTEDSSVPVDVVGLGAGVTAIDAGAAHTCVIVNGAAKCWGGGNGAGQLGNGTTGGNNQTPVDVVGLGSGVTAISAGANNTCAIVNSAAKCWGAGTFGQLGSGVLGNSSVPVDVLGHGAGVTAIVAGAGHNCAVMNGAARCWGSNAHGALGNGTMGGTSETPDAVVGLGSGVTEISAGSQHTCAIVNGAAMCWGRGDLGGLGNGAMESSAFPVTVGGPPEEDEE